MAATTPARVAAGKSAIHGWGAFAKVPHAAGDMIVEYVGSLVRPSVADSLERRHYNSVVGAGTYIFRLNEDLCVDATLAGSVAHLLNHSCAPCCHSRTITVAHPATGERRDHVVIFASRDIAAGEELTYDYRFAGEEKLPCNCGAPTCRGMVNAPADDEGGAAPAGLRVRRRDLQPVGAGGVAATAGGGGGAAVKRAV
ncbi:MAG: putative SET-domain transcriptional regulator [Monoraphidium minutum]|nr:MAG: putative SET-domain transcriptional regulator [Monoraphidium minutum]